MSTVSGANTRRYHGLLVAATKAPEIRTVLLASVEAYIQVGAESIGLSANQYVGTVHPQGYNHLTGFSIGQTAEWQFEVRGAKIIKRVGMHEGVNAVSLEYENVGEGAIQLSLRPLVSHKFYHDNFRITDFYPEFLVFPEDKTVLSHHGVKLVLSHKNAERTATTGWFYRFEHPLETERGLDPLDDLFCPCELRYLLAPGEKVALVASTEDGVEPLSLPQAGETQTATSSEALVAQLEASAKQFIVETPERTSIIAGYPWFTDWGRDTMISLPGICLETGHFDQARAILRSYASQMKRGVIPNRFVDQGDTPDYNTVDATLWFVNAIYQTLHADWDQGFAQEALAWTLEIYEWHLKGTWYGIKVDSTDGLLRQGEPGVQLTWMDAKVRDWVVTPRHGKPVEINGLWCNMLRVMEWLSEKLGQPSADFAAAARKAESAMEQKFWHAMTGHYLDTVEPNDASLRPNQVIAMSLPFAPLKGDNALRALTKIERELLTPFGLRTLGPSEPGYVARFEGPMEQRDAGYHQGTVWPWLIGPYISAVLRLTGDTKRAMAALSHILDSLAHYGLNGIAEVYDGDAPQYPGGCPWQAWSVAEALRSWREIERASR